MRVHELIAVLQQLPPEQLVALQTLHNGFCPATCVVSDCGVTYIRDHVLHYTVEYVQVQGVTYEVIR